MMQSRATLLLVLVAAILCSLTSVSGQGRRVLGTIAVKAPVTLLPDPSRTPLATLPEGTQVQVLAAEEDGWYRILFQDNYVLGDRVGYVRAEYVKVSERVLELGPDRGLTPGAPERLLNGWRDENSASHPAGTNGSASTARVTRENSRNGLKESDVATAIVRGQRQRTGSPGLRLLDSGEAWTQEQALRGSGPRPLFRLQIHTPLSWIQQLSSDAARASRRFRLDEVTEEMTRPVLRVTAYTDVTTTARGTTGASWVRHAVLRDASRSHVIQPTSKEAFSEHVVRSAAGGGRVSEGVILTFPLDAVRQLKGDGEAAFFITVIGPKGEKKDVRITTQELASLPM